MIRLFGRLLTNKISVPLVPDITYNLDGGVGDDDARPGDADDVDEAKYMDAYERYRQHMRDQRQTQRNGSSAGDLESESE